MPASGPVSEIPATVAVAQFVQVAPDLWVANLVAQHGLKSGREGPPIRYEAVAQCLQQVAERARELGASAHMPRIGCGLAGGEWSRIEPLLEEHLCRRGVAVTVYDRMASPARKFLLAGRGGLNLTHSEPLEDLLGRYSCADATLRAAIEAFPPAQVQTWCEALGQETFVGTSGRVFPKAMKASLRQACISIRSDWLSCSTMPRARPTGWRRQSRGSPAS